MLDFEDAAREPRQPRDLAAVVPDRRRDAGVRRAQHRPAGLERAHRRDLVVLHGGDRVAVPRVVGDVDEQRRVARAADQLGAERILVADVDGDALAGDVERRLRRAAARLVGERNRQHLADEPADDRLQRNRLAERHEVMLAVELQVASPSAHDAVVVARLVAAGLRRFRGEEAEQHVAVARARHRGSAPAAPRRALRRRTSGTRSRAARRGARGSARRAAGRARTSPRETPDRT